MQRAHYQQRVQQQRCSSTSAPLVASRNAAQPRRPERKHETLLPDRGGDGGGGGLTYEDLKRMQRAPMSVSPCAAILAALGLEAEDLGRNPRLVVDPEVLGSALQVLMETPSPERPDKRAAMHARLSAGLVEAGYEHEVVEGVDNVESGSASAAVLLTPRALLDLLGPK